MNWTSALLFGAALEQSLNSMRLVVQGKPNWVVRLSSAIGAFALTFGLVGL